MARDAGFTAYVAGYAQLDVGPATSIQVTGLSEGTYHYRVRAVDADGTAGSPSNSMAVTIKPQSSVET